MEWTFPWASSSGSDFNADFNIAFTEEQQRKGGIEYNYRPEAVFEWRAGQEGAARARRPSSRPCAEPMWPPTIATGRA
jgi:predicted dithiol-disulfide oxidoreductase (DUF899 family)